MNLPKLKRKAKLIANMVEKKGEIIKHDLCQECGFKTKKLDKHHQNYNKPKEVIYLCRSCHITVHQGSSVFGLRFFSLKMCSS